MFIAAGYVSLTFTLLVLHCLLCYFAISNAGSSSLQCLLLGVSLTFTLLVLSICHNCLLHKMSLCIIVLLDV